MKSETFKKYRPFPRVPLMSRAWPDKSLNQAPIWCSVDLRDGNQALIQPLNMIEKLEFFQLLIDVGFKEIEVGFPSASPTEFQFIRKLIEDKLIPQDVTIQVLTQSREHLIHRTFAAIQGAPKAIVHLYNSTSPAQRKIVFQKSKGEIIKIAIEGASLIKKLAQDTDGEIILEYSPESFSQTELEFSREIAQKVRDTWDASPERKMILNLPATVEIAMPNVYADQIEWMLQNIAHRESFIISLHTHNDRGTAVAASELGLLAGAERVEGTLFGNGERTGNVDIITLALNLFSQGIAPQLDFGNINQIAETYEKCTRIPVHKRHPYAGELVYTAFSGSHQDAIAKGMAFREQMLHKNSAPENMPHSFWEVPYLPIDPKDLGRNYEAIIRLNSQSGKGGAAYILKKYFGIDLPKNMHPEFSSLIQARADVAETEIKPALVYQIFEDEYLNQNQPLSFQNFKSIYENGSDAMQCELFIEKAGETIKLAGNGNGPIDACKGALNQILEKEFSIESYTEHSLSKGSDSRAIAFIEVKNYQGKSYFGAGLDTNITKASVKALICALNRNLVGG